MITARHKGTLNQIKVKVNNRSEIVEGDEADCHVGFASSEFCKDAFKSTLCIS